MEYKIKSHFYTHIFIVVVFMSFIPVSMMPQKYDLRGKRTFQSDDFEPKFNSTLAVDGCYDTVMDNLCCTHTSDVQPGWWSVDLGEPVIVNSVKVFNRDTNRERLSNFSVYGSNSSHMFSSDSTKCANWNDGVGASKKLVCESPVMAQYVIIKKHPRDDIDKHILTLCEVEIEICPKNTYEKDCLTCGHCQNTQCDWTSETGVCFDGCEAGYTGDICKTVCASDTYGIGCLPCSPNCLNTKCEKFSDTMNCTEGCVAGKLGDDCSQDCPNKTYGIGCKNCSSNCRDSECLKTSEIMECKDGCEAGYKGNNCSSICEGNTFGIGCQFCSQNCTNTTCKKFSETLICIDGCITGKTGDDCSQDCPSKTYGIGCQNCSINCRDAECLKTSETMECTDGCEAGYKGNDCSLNCPSKTYGIGCQNCSINCRDAECLKTSETMECTDGCEAGYKGNDCSLERTYGIGCQPCPENCKDSQCHKFSEGIKCLFECATGFSGDACQNAEKLEQESPGGSTGATVGAVVAVLAVTIVIGVILGVYIRRRQQKKPKKEGNFDLGEGDDFYSVAKDSPDIARRGLEVKPRIAPKPVHSTDNQYTDSQKGQEDAAAVTGALTEDNNVYVNVDIKEEPSLRATYILIQELGQYMEAMNFHGSGPEEEYEDIPKTTSLVSEAEKPELKSKNRYKNVLPYNHNQVRLQIQDGNPLTDYINASFIKDYHGKVSYIAALGSTNITLPDTWRMIWEHEIKSIFMVTNLTEEAKIKCEQYWPSHGLQTYGEITVTLEEEITDPYIVIRKLTLTKAGEQRSVTQYHYISWPDKKPPLNVTSIVKLRSYLKEVRQNHSSPILVHCSAGIGRTGTLIALDILLDQMDAEGAVDIKQCVTRLRQQRTQMVQTVVQYKFLYQCLLEISTLGSTAVFLKKVPGFLNSGEFKQRTQKEYQFLQQVKPVITQDDIEFGRMQNKEKNRDNDVIPLMDARVKLSSFPEIYINAVYVRGYKGPKEFCATQWPLESTAGDFWKVILQEKSAAIVCMEKIEDSEWFGDKSLSVKYDDIDVSGKCIAKDSETEVYDIFMKQHKSTDIDDSPAEYANVKPISPSKESDHQLKMIVVKSWTAVEITTRDLKLIPAVYRKVQAIVNLAQQKAVTVTCRNGADETGLYIGASILFDMINKEKQVDVVQVVKQIRKSRPQFITNQEQYRWLYYVCNAILAEAN